MKELSSVALLFFAFVGNAVAQGVQPVPDIIGASVETVVNAGVGQLEYQYSIVNPNSTTGRIWLFKVDISSMERGGPTTVDPSNSGQASYPVQGGASTEPMVPLINLLAPFTGLKGTDILVVGQAAPGGWNGGVTRQGYAQFSARNTSFAITPGSATGGFSITSIRPPTIRQASITPHWVFEVADHTVVTEEEMESAAQVQQSIPVQVSVLGPSDIAAGGDPHYSQLLGDISRARDIGWVTDDVLTNDVLDDIGNALSEFRIGNNGLAESSLQNAIAAVESANQISFNQEFRDLVLINVQTLIGLLPSFQNTFIPVFTADPLSADLEREDTFVLTMRYFNSALEGNPPLQGLRILVRCLPDRVFTDPFDPTLTYFDCANSDQLVPGQTFTFTETGEVVFSYVGRNTGVDVIEIVENDFEAFRRLAIVEVNWTAEADLVVPLFAPPLVFASENDTIFITETTSNVGTVDVVAPSATSYYITDTDNITADNIDTASFLGERIIPPLAAGESSHASEQEFVIPSGFTGDVHFLAACADDDEEIVESNEENNCSYTEVERVFDVGVLIEDPNANNPPLANDQVVVTDQDNPVSVTLTGQDNDGDTLTFSINSGPVNGALSGTAPNLTYLPNSGFDGSDSFTFTVNDGTIDSNVATVTITVNDINSPPIANSQAVSTSEDIPVAVILTGQDDDGDTLSFSIAANPTYGSLSGTAPNLTYTPNAGFSGADSFTFTANDGIVDSNVATVSITVNMVNLAPVADAGPDQTENEGLLVTLDGSASTNATNYAWSQVAGPTVSLSSTTLVNPDFTTPFVSSNATLTFQLIVDDGAGNFSDPDTVDITVVDVVRSHYTCYKAKTPKDTNFFETLKIGLNDQFESNAYDTVKVERLCAPANKTAINFTDDEADEPAALDGTHLLSYKIDEFQLSCGACSGGVDQITIQYSGTDPVSFIVDGKVTDIGPYSLASDESLALFGDDNNGKMGSSIKFIDEFNGDEIAAFHTSCSRPIGIGTESQNGLFTVTGGSSVNAGELGVCDDPVPVGIKPPWDTCAACKGGVSFARFAYNGTAGTVTVTDSKGNTLFDSPLATGDMFEILPVAGKDKLEKTIFLTGAGGTVDIHTSCSKPFGPGFVVGDFRVLEGASKKGGADMCPVVRIENQFGSEFLSVNKPKRLMVPSLKDLSGPVTGDLPTDTDHYKCYDVKALNVHKGLEINLEDQFDTRDFEIDKVKQLCNPVEKTHGGVVTPIQNDANHLACYKIKPLQKGFCELVDPNGDPNGLPVGVVCSKDEQCGAGLFCEKEVDTQAYLLNQFDNELVNIEKAYELCVPSSMTIDVL